MELMEQELGAGVAVTAEAHGFPFQGPGHVLRLDYDEHCTLIIICSLSGGWSGGSAVKSTC